MEEVKLRGEKVWIDRSKKYLVFSIRKPLGDSFSISDKIYDLVKEGYNVEVNFLSGSQMITKDSIPFMEEKVESKFPNSPSWYRYWFRKQKRNKNQTTLI